MNPFEIVLIGTGGGYGESIVIRWDESYAVVDSCINPVTKRSLALEYLEEKSVDIGQVKFVLATHWHDDHIRGISQVIDKCPNAVFWTTASKDMSAFLRLVAADGFDRSSVKGYEDLSRSSERAMSEVDKCIEIIKNRGGRGFRRAQLDQLFYSGVCHGQRLEIYALSPSHEVMENYDSEIARLIDLKGQYGHKLSSYSANDKSVAIYIRWGDCGILLGADLENGRFTGTGYTGWEAVLQEAQCMNGCAAVVNKVAHHGSSGAQHPGIWNTRVDHAVQSIMTPWRIGMSKWVPDDIEMEYITEKSSATYITSVYGGIGGPKPRASDVNKLMTKLGINASEIKYQYGRIELSWDSNTGGWSVDTKGSATSV